MSAAAIPAPGLSRVLLKGMLLIATLLAGGWLIETTGFTLDAAWIDTQVRGRGLEGEVVFLVVATALLALGLPRQIAAFSAGYAFGIVEGCGWTLAATTVACVIAFGYARMFGRGFVQRRFGRRVARLDAFLSAHPFTTTLLIRLLPIGNNLATNLAAGVSGVSAWRFVAGSAVGYVPQTVVFALLGSGVRINPALRISVSVALFVVSGLLGTYLFRKLRRADGAAVALAEEP